MISIMIFCNSPRGSKKHDSPLSIPATSPSKREEERQNTRCLLLFFFSLCETTDVRGCVQWSLHDHTFFCERRTVPTHCQSWSDEGALNFRIQCHFSQGSSLIHNLTVISYWNRTRRYKKLHFDFGLPLYHLHLPQKNPKNFNIKARLRVGFVSSVAHDGHTSSPQSRGYWFLVMRINIRVFHRVMCVAGYVYMYISSWFIFPDEPGWSCQLSYACFKD